MKRVLFINPFGIGDTIFTLRLAESVKSADPLCFVGFLGNERTAELLSLASAVDKVFVFSRDRFRKVWRESPWRGLKKTGSFVGEFRAEKFDVAVDLSLGGDYAMGAWAAGIRRRVGFDYERRGFFLNRKIKFKGYEGQAVTDKQMQLLPLAKLRHVPAQTKLSFRLTERAFEEVDAFLAAHGILEGDRFLAVAPGGGRSWGKNALYKQWPAERFAEVANRWAAPQRAKILLVGDSDEEALLARTSAELRVPYALACGFSMEKVCLFLRRSEALLSNDGGLMHLASALGVKTAAIFGPVNESVYGPYGGSGQSSEVLVEPVACRPCYRDFHFPPCPYERRCLTELQPEKVLEALKKIT